jgi:hypothetical protein
MGGAGDGDGERDGLLAHERREAVRAEGGEAAAAAVEGRGALLKLRERDGGLELAEAGVVEAVVGVGRGSGDGGARRRRGRGRRGVERSRATSAVVKTVAAAMESAGMARAARVSRSGAKRARASAARGPSGAAPWSSAQTAGETPRGGAGGVAEGAAGRGRRSGDRQG